jgi:hypothetical protein
MPKFRVILERTDLVIYQWVQVHVANILIEMAHLK